MPPLPKLARPPSKVQLKRKSTMFEAMERTGLVVTVKGGPQSEFELDCGRGVRRGLSYIPNEYKGMYEVHVTWHGKPIQGSPFMVAADE